MFPEADKNRSPQQTLSLQTTSKQKEKLKPQESGI